MHKKLRMDSQSICCTNIRSMHAKTSQSSGSRGFLLYAASYSSNGSTVNSIGIVSGKKLWPFSSSCLRRLAVAGLDRLTLYN